MIRPLFNALLDPSAIHANPYISSKLYPLAGQSTGHVQLRADAPASGPGERLPIPPMHLWEGYASTPEEYLKGGQREMGTMLAILSKAGASPQELTKVLDFGCAAGRMLRFYPREGTPELWGVDINAKHINWCQLNLGPPFFFATTTTAPHLPFEDGYFDLIYSGSVFTHISDLADAWLLELRRIVRKGGYLYITIHDKRTVDVLLTKYKDHPLFREFVELVRSFCERTGVLSQNYAYFTVLADPISQVFYNEEYLVRKWSQWAEVLSITPEAHYHQAALPTSEVEEGNCRSVEHTSHLNLVSSGLVSDDLRSFHIMAALGLRLPLSLCIKNRLRSLSYFREIFADGMPLAPAAFSSLPESGLYFIDRPLRYCPRRKSTLPFDQPTPANRRRARPQFGDKLNIELLRRESDLRRFDHSSRVPS